MNDALREAALDALEWLRLFERANAVGLLGRGQREAVIRENRALLAAAIAALDAALEEEDEILSGAT